MRASILEDSKKYKFKFEDYEHEGMPLSGSDDTGEDHSSDSDEDDGISNKE